MAIKHIARQYDYVGLSTDDKNIIATEGAVIYYTDTQKREIYHDGSWTEYLDNVDVDLAGLSVSVDNVGIKDVDTNETVSVDADGNLATKNTNKYEDLIFHNESATPNSGLEFEVKDYKNLRIGVTGTATSFTLLFRGQVGDVVTALLGIDSNSLELLSSTTIKETTYEFDIESYEKVWFGLSAVDGGNITVKGRVAN